MIEKIVNIGGKEVKLKSTAGTLRKYRNNFGRDLIKDISKLQDKLKKVKTSDDQFSVIDLEMYEDIAWSMAKTADPSIKPIDEWLDDFDTFDIITILPIISDLLIDNLKTQNNPKNTVALVNQLAK